MDCFFFLFTAFFGFLWGERRVRLDGLGWKVKDFVFCSARILDRGTVGLTLVERVYESFRIHERRAEKGDERPGCTGMDGCARTYLSFSFSLYLFLNLVTPFPIHRLGNV